MRFNFPTFRPHQKFKLPKKLQFLQGIDSKSVKIYEQQVKVSENKKQTTLNPKHTILSWQRMKKIVISLFLWSPIIILLAVYNFKRVHYSYKKIGNTTSTAEHSQTTPITHKSLTKF